MFMKKGCILLVSIRVVFGRDENEGWNMKEGEEQVISNKKDRLETTCGGEWQRCIKQGNDVYWMDV